MSDSRLDGAPVDPNQFEPPRPDPTAAQPGSGQWPAPPPYQYGPGQWGPAEYPPYPSPGYPQQSWLPGQPPDYAAARPRRGRRGLVIALLAAVVLVAAAVASYFLFVSGGSGSSPKAAAKAWLDALNARDLIKVKSLTCAQDRNLIGSTEPPGSFRIIGTKLTDAKHAVVRVVFNEDPFPVTQQADLPVAYNDGWQVCFGPLGPVH
jgi:hypothetical protein